MLDKQKVIVDLGQRIRVLREDKGLTIKEMAYKIDIEYNNLIRIEKGRTNVTVGTLVKIANGLDINIGELFTKI